MSRLVEALVAVATHPRWRSMTVEQFVEALYIADARHRLDYGRSVDLIEELGEAVRRYVEAPLSGWSESEEAALREAIARYVEGL